MEHLDEHDARALRLSAAMHRRIVPLPITMESDEAADKRKADDGAAALAAVLAVIGVVMALAVAAVVYQVWPLLVAVL